MTSIKEISQQSQETRDSLRIPIAISVGVTDESEREAAETRQASDGGGIRMVGGGEGHDAAARCPPVVYGVGHDTVEAGKAVAAR